MVLFSESWSCRFLNFELGRYTTMIRRCEATPRLAPPAAKSSQKPMTVEYKGENITFDVKSRRFSWQGNVASSIKTIEKMIDKEQSALPIHIPVYVRYEDEFREGVVVDIEKSRKRYGTPRARVEWCNQMVTIYMTDQKR